MKKNKHQILCLILFIVPLFGFSQQDSIDTELSYKTGESEPRYLKSFSEVPYTIPADYSAHLPDSDSLRNEILYLLNSTGEHASKTVWFKGLEDEHLYMYITDIGNMPFTFHINKGKYKVSEGFDKSKLPSQVLPLTLSNLINLNQILSDGKLSYEEKYRIYYIDIVPALKAIYKNKVMYLAGDKTMFHFDDFVHITIPPEEEVLYNGHPISIEATVVNVDGQWLVFRGLQGEADFKISLTIDEATKLYKMGFYEVRKLKSAKQSQKLSIRFLDYLEEVTETVRNDHKD